MLRTHYLNRRVVQFCGDCREGLPFFPDNSIDLVATDPPYGISFMGKDWDRALPDKETWRQCLRVLKPGAFAFVMSIPRADCLSRMIISLEDAGFLVNFTPIFWAYATGFPKAQNMSKVIDKRLGIKRTDAIDGGHRGIVVGAADGHGENYNADIPHEVDCGRISRGTAVSPEAQDLEGSYAGFQPKPAVEVVIVAMKPLSAKSFTDQALLNGKGVTWLDHGRIPFRNRDDVSSAERKNRHADFGSGARENRIFGEDKRIRAEHGNYSAAPGRFPANLVVSDDVLDDGHLRKGSPVGFKGTGWKHSGNTKDERTPLTYQQAFDDAGTFSRYFDLDAWWEKQLLELPASVQATFPFLVTPKAFKGERDRGLDEMPEVVKSALPLRDGSGNYVENVAGDGTRSTRGNKVRNYHPTVKPIKLMSYLVALGSCDGDVVLDPYFGTGTTGIACGMLNRFCIGIEIRADYHDIAARRCAAIQGGLCTSL